MFGSALFGRHPWHKLFITCNLLITTCFFPSADALKGRFQKATFASGDFHNAEESWGCMPGVKRTRVGYISVVQWRSPQATPKSPYIGANVETVEIDFDPTQTNYSRLLEHFWTLHSHERVYQGPRASGSWTPAIYCHSQEQCDLAEHSKERLQEKKGRPLITEIQPNNTFLEAEPEHQKHMLRSRTDVFETFKLGDRALVKSHAAALINAYLGGKCHGVRTWEETEEAIMV
mmetsp:Transcript_27485/g.60061  ORF Transcript_27485/g.60061 Transcript_27485/m.60061 type:complete len:232 (+) Transcript_27485:214-909(+)